MHRHEGTWVPSPGPHEISWAWKAREMARWWRLGTRVQVLAPTWSTSQLPITRAPRDLMPFSILYIQIYRHTDTHRPTHSHTPPLLLLDQSSPWKCLHFDMSLSSFPNVFFLPYTAHPRVLPNIWTMVWGAYSSNGTTNCLLGSRTYSMSEAWYFSDFTQ